MSIKAKNLFDQIHRSILTPCADKVAKELSCYGDWKLGSYIRVSVSKIAKNTKLHERTVRRCLKLLRSLGFITRVKPHSMSKQTPTEYKLNYEAIQFSIEASKSLFKDDEIKEIHRKARKLERRIEREKAIKKFLFSESVDNIEKYDEINEKTPGRMPGNNVAIDYCINIVGFNNSVDNFMDTEVAYKHITKEFYLPCDTIGQPSQDLKIRNSLGIVLMGKEDDPDFMDAIRYLNDVQASELGH